MVGRNSGAYSKWAPVQHTNSCELFDKISLENVAEIVLQMKIHIAELIS